MEPHIKRQSSLTRSVRSTAINSAPQIQHAYAHSVTGGAGGRGTRISQYISTSPSFGTRLAGSFGYGYDHESTGSTSGALAISNEKITMQHLNDRLANYLETVRKLEKDNNKLEIQIREAIKKQGPLEGRDYSRYYTTIEELREKIFDMIKDNARLEISLDNMRLATDDFRVKVEYELSLRQTVEADIAGLRKILDDTNIIRLHLETDIESLKEELVILKKNHETDVADLRAQIMQAGVHVDVDTPKGQDLTRIMEEMRAKYEKIALKNQDELKAWHESQITEVQVQVTESTTALKEATTVVNETRRRCQALDIERQSALRLNASLEATLPDIEARYSREIEKYNAFILRLQDELTQIRTDIQQITRDYEHLLNIKVKLEAEIAEYRRLLDVGTPLELEDALDQKTGQTKILTATRTLADGKVKASEKVVSEKQQ